MNGEEKKILTDFAREIGHLAANQENMASDIKEIKEEMSSDIKEIKEKFVSKCASKEDVKDEIASHVAKEHDEDKKVGHFVRENKKVFIWIVIVTILVILTLFGFDVDISSLPLG